VNLYSSQYYIVISVTSERFILHIPKLLRYNPTVPGFSWLVLSGKILFIIIGSHCAISDNVITVSILQTIASNKFLILFF